MSHVFALTTTDIRTSKEFRSKFCIICDILESTVLSKPVLRQGYRINNLRCVAAYDGQ